MSTTAVLMALLAAILPTPPEPMVSHVPVSLPGWPAEAAPARVLLLADLHAERSHARRVEAMVQRALEQKPEATILLGDYHKLGAGERNMPARELAARLAPLRSAGPVFYVCGNHDISPLGAELRREFDARGFVCVEQKDAPLQFANGCRACLRGVPFRSETRPPGMMQKRFLPAAAPPDQPLLVAAHNPWHFLCHELPAELVVAGHTHGGQVCLPGGRPLCSRGMWTGRLMQAGLRQGRAAGQQLYISRGVGTSSVPLRLGCPPEISLLLLSGSGLPLQR